MLSNHERVPDRAELRALGPDVDAVLREIIEQPSHRLLARTRAIALLGEFRSKTNAKLLLQVIKDNAEVRRGLGLIDLQHALIAYAAQRGPKALEVLEPFLSHAKLDVRARAARAVRVAGGPEAKRALKLQLDNEPSATVRVEIQRQLELLEKPQRAGSR
jgi:HEAT repeat protein